MLSDKKGQVTYRPVPDVTFRKKFYWERRNTGAGISVGDG
jgi:hypothetical protein